VTDTDTDGTPEPEPQEEAPTLHGVPIVLARGQLVAFPARAGYYDLIRALTDDGYEMCVDLCGVDYLVNPARQFPAGIVGERFEVVVNMLSFSRHARIRVRVQVPESDPTIASIFDLHPGTEAQERETYDMFGIVFEGHPDLTRILMPDDWEGHPLRKDYGMGRIPVQFKAPRGNPR
jgi:NADH-quinone oxidoreductase subunit C